MYIPSCPGNHDTSVLSIQLLSTLSWSRETRTCAFLSRKQETFTFHVLRSTRLLHLAPVQEPLSSTLSSCPENPHYLPVPANCHLYLLLHLTITLPMRGTQNTFFPGHLLYFRVENFADFRGIGWRIFGVSHPECYSCPSSLSVIREDF
jgi:hypothetical protein